MDQPPTGRVYPVDERDAKWEVDSPPFRVFLWTGGYACAAYELIGVDVQQAIAWAEEQAAGTERTYTLFACHTNVDGRYGMLRLAGGEPTHDPADTDYYSFRIRP
jgi:hypothetical protein